MLLPRKSGRRRESPGSPPTTCTNAASIPRMYGGHVYHTADAMPEMEACQGLLRLILPSQIQASPHGDCSHSCWAGWNWSHRQSLLPETLCQTCKSKANKSVHDGMSSSSDRQHWIQRSLITPGNERLLLSAQHRPSACDRPLLTAQSSQQLLVNHNMPYCIKSESFLTAHWKGPLHRCRGPHASPTFWGLSEG